MGTAGERDARLRVVVANASVERLAATSEVLHALGHDVVSTATALDDL